MSFSYSGIVGYGKLNLPSVDSWSTNNNILKDPPRSVVAHRKDKVGANSSITEEIEMSRDRIAESIMAYPRGVNPMVGISYNGQGNAGIKSFRGQQAKLPYRVMMDGAFRAPVLAPVDLLPLSRMPRLVTKVNCAVNKPDFQKKLTCGAPGKTYRTQLLNTSCCANSTYPIKRPSRVIDRRHTNIRKNAHAVDVQVNRGAPISTNRAVTVPVRMKETVKAEALHVNKMKRPIHVQRTNPNSFRCIQKTLEGTIPGAIVGPRKSSTTQLGLLQPAHNVREVLVSSTNAPIQGPRQGTLIPSTLGTCRENEFRAEMLPTTVIDRAFDTERPAYKRTFGLGGVLVPENGIYNVARK